MYTILILKKMSLFKLYSIEFNCRYQLFEISPVKKQLASVFNAKHRMLEKKIHLK